MKNYQMLFALFVVGAVAILVGCAPQKSANEMMAEKNKALTQTMYDGFNADDWNKIGTVIAADFVEHNPEPGQKPGLNGLKEIFAMYRSAFPDMKFTASNVVAEGDMVVARVVFTGTNKGDFMGKPPTGKSVTVDGYDMMRFANGKGVEHWGVYDNMNMMMQLGMMPTPVPVPAAGKDMKK